MGPLDLFVLLFFFPGRFGGPPRFVWFTFLFPGRFGVGPLDLFVLLFLFSWPFWSGPPRFVCFTFPFFLAVLEWAP